jgi:hypothetical protein
LSHLICKSSVAKEIYNLWNYLPLFTPSWARLSWQLWVPLQSKMGKTIYSCFTTFSLKPLHSILATKCEVNKRGLCFTEEEREILRG